MARFAFRHLAHKVLGAKAPKARKRAPVESGIPLRHSRNTLFRIPIPGSKSLGRSRNSAGPVRGGAELPRSFPGREVRFIQDAVSGPASAGGVPMVFRNIQAKGGFLFGALLLACAPGRAQHKLELQQALPLDGPVLVQPSGLAWDG